MANISTPSLTKIEVHTGLKPATKLSKLRKDSAQKVNELLNHNHQQNHVFFLSEDKTGVNLHNHLSHHALTLFAIGASPDQIEIHHQRNQLYQRNLPKSKQTIIKNLDDPVVFKDNLGKDESYASFLTYFDRKLTEMGLKNFLAQFVFGPSEQAQDLLIRLFYGYLHPILSVGFGIEFEQLAIVSEGLGQACCHRDDYLNPVFRQTDELSRNGKIKPSTLVDCLDALRANVRIRNSCDISYYRQASPGKGFFIKRDAIRDGVIAQGGQDLIEIASRWQVREDEVARKVAEVTNTAAYILCSAQKTPYESRYDFFTLHGLTASIHFAAFLKEPAIHPADVARLVEYLGRTVILLYVAIGCPEPNLSHALSHPPKNTAKTWEDVFKLATLHNDDGHLCKGIRGLGNAQDLSLPYDDRPEFRLKQNMFLPLACALLDSGSDHPMFGGHPLDWIRGAGFEGAWKKIPKRKSSPKLVATY